MNVVHISQTPVAGSPGNIVRALNRLTRVRARHIVFDGTAYGSRTFALDIDWRRQPDEAFAAIAAADAIHLHQYFSIDETFGPDFHAALRGKPTLRQYHSVPDLWAKGDPHRRQQIVNDDLPQLVIAQGPERYYPRARIVPNIVPLDDTRYRPLPEAPGIPIVTFSPSNLHSTAWKARWETKGTPQTLALLRRIERAGVGRVRLIAGMPHDACLRAKQDAAVALDECITGNYHLSGLEALAQGKPTLGYLDARVQQNLRSLTGALELPWINVRLEEAELPLRDLLADAALRADLGAASRRWMERYYAEHAMITHYVDAYRDLLEAPERLRTTRLDSVGERWRALVLPNHLWTSRKARSSAWRRLQHVLGIWPASSDTRA